MKIIKFLSKLIIVCFILSIYPSASYSLDIRNTFVFDPDNTQFFDPSDSNNIGYFLNNDFYNSLSQKELIVNHSWDIKFENGTGTQNNVNAKIALISYSEWQYYRGKVLPLGGAGDYWWTRTPYSGLSRAVWVVDPNGSLYSNLGDAQYHRNVYPVLYLKPGLFLSESNEVQESGDTPLHSGEPGTLIRFSNMYWVILEQLADGTTYIILDFEDDSGGGEDPPPDSPAGLYVDNITQTSARANWTAVSGATGYHVYLDGVKIGSTSGTSYPLSGLAPETTYNVTVSAYSYNGEGEKCTPVSFTTNKKPLWTPLPGMGMGFSVKKGQIWDTFTFIFELIKGSFWPFILAFLALFVAGLLWKIWRRVAR